MPTTLRTPLLAVLLAASAGFACAADNSPSPATLDGTVKFTGGIVGVGVGYKWGYGTLAYQGQQFKFCIRGLSVGDVGVASINAQGNVYNLKQVEDFTGRYFSISGGFALGRGESGALLKNKRGVMVELEMLEDGLRFDIAAAGVRITLAGQHGCKGR